jgi:hypothetical protein
VSQLTFVRKYGSYCPARTKTASVGTAKREQQ